MANEDKALFDRGRPPTAEERARGTIWVLDEKTADEVAAEQAAYDEANKVNRLAIAVPQLLPTARAIFGDIIEAVYFLKDSSDSNYNREQLQIKYEVKREHFSCTKQINVDASDVVLKFTNGRHVTFTTSEWGHIEATAPFTEISVE